MHKTINKKHRIVRRVNIEIAPLATFDTIDLGDEDVSPGLDIDDIHLLKGQDDQLNQTSKDGNLKTEIIGGNNSKKSLSPAGGEEKEAQLGQVDNEAEIESRKDVGDEKCSSSLTHRADTCVLETSPEIKIANSQRRRSPPPPPKAALTNASPISTGKLSTQSEKPVVCRQGSLGRVKLPIRKQASESSSSSDSVSDPAPVAFRSRSPDSHESQPISQDDFEEDTHLKFLPDNIDPSQILSPSRRKAYQRRLERLKVTTSPIARPRSTAPISVVTLEEYAVLSSPEISPATPPTLQNKLKITLPSEDFAGKYKSPKHHSSSPRKDSNKSCFDFTEGILFSRTKSQLVVDEASGHAPLSPRRVLIPPSNTRHTSSPNLSHDNCGTDTLLEKESEKWKLHSNPKLKQIQADQKIFGETVDINNDDDWASFPDTLQLDGDTTIDENVLTEENNCFQTDSQKPSVHVISEENRNHSVTLKRKTDSSDIQKDIISDPINSPSKHECHDLDTDAPGLNQNDVIIDHVNKSTNEESAARLSGFVANISPSLCSDPHLAPLSEKTLITSSDIEITQTSCSDLGLSHESSSDQSYSSSSDLEYPQKLGSDILNRGAPLSNSECPQNSSPDIESTLSNLSSEAGLSQVPCSEFGTTHTSTSGFKPVAIHGKCEAFDSKEISSAEVKTPPVEYRKPIKIRVSNDETVVDPLTISSDALPSEDLCPVKTSDVGIDSLEQKELHLHHNHVNYQDPLLNQEQLHPLGATEKDFTFVAPSSDLVTLSETTKSQEIPPSNNSHERNTSPSADSKYNLDLVDTIKPNLVTKNNANSNSALNSSTNPFLSGPTDNMCAQIAPHLFVDSVDIPENPGNDLLTEFSMPQPCNSSSGDLIDFSSYLDDSAA